jgi:hypothetical protein
VPAPHQIATVRLVDGPPDSGSAGKREEPVRRIVVPVEAEPRAGQPYPLRTDRVVFLVEPEHAWGMAFG